MGELGSRCILCAVAATLFSSCGDDGGPLATDDAGIGRDGSVADAATADASPGDGIALSNLRLIDVTADGFVVEVDVGGDLDGDASVLLSLCGGTPVAPCDPDADGGPPVAMQRDGDVYRAVVQPSPVLFTRAFVRVSGSDPDGVSGTPLDGFADMPVALVAVGAITVTDMTATGFTVHAEFFGDVNANAVFELGFCNLFNSITCSPNTNLIMTRGANSYDFTVTGLVAPNDPFDLLLIKVDAIDPNGAVGSGATTSAWITPVDAVAFTATEIGAGHRPGAGMTGFVGYHGDADADAAVSVRYCNTRLDPACDPSAGVGPIALVRHHDQFSAPLGPLPAGYQTGDRLRLAFAVTDPDGTSETDLRGTATVDDGAGDPAPVHGWWGTSCVALGGGFFLRTFQRFDRHNFSGTIWLYPAASCTGTPIVGLTAGSYSLGAPWPFIRGAVEVDSVLSEDDGSDELRYDFVRVDDSLSIDRLFFGATPGSSPGSRPTTEAAFGQFAIADGATRSPPPIWVPPIDLVISGVASSVTGFGNGVAISGESAYVAGSFSAPVQRFDFDAATGRWLFSASLGVASCSSNARAIAVSGPAMGIGCFAGGFQFKRLSGSTWNNVSGGLTTPIESGEMVGQSVAVDGDLAVLGAPTSPFVTGAGPGAAYILRFNGSAWVEEARIEGSDATQRNSFGKAVAVAGGVVSVGAPQDNAVYVFERVDGVWTETAKLTGDGLADSLTATADRIIAGAPTAGFPNPGAVYVFHRPDAQSAWTEEQVIVPAVPLDSNFFGQTVAVSGDRLVVGSLGLGSNPDRGRTYFFDRTGSTWSQQGPFSSAFSAGDDDYGSAVAIDGPWAMTGARDLHDGLGGVYVHENVGGTWEGP